MEGPVFDAKKSASVQQLNLRPRAFHHPADDVVAHTVSGWTRPIFLGQEAKVVLDALHLSCLR